MGTPAITGAARLLGYPDDARLLIVNADDYGMHAGINAAVPRALAGLATSTSLMVPCPGAPDAIAWLASHPAVPLGVHLTLVRDAGAPPWSPVAPRSRVPSLLDADGALPVARGAPASIPHAALDELEIEFRAQIDAVLAAGLHPTHLDWHSLLDGGREDAHRLAVRLALEYGLALRVGGAAAILELRARGLPTADRMFLDSFRIPTAAKPGTFLRLLRELPEGLSEWAVHPSTGEAATRGIDGGWAVRRADLAFLTSSEAHEAVLREGITLLDYRPLQAAWRAADRGRTGAL